MTDKGSFSDEELIAYLDGQADSRTVELLERALAGDSQLQQRLDRLALNRDEVRAAFDGLLDQAPAPPSILVPEIEEPAPPTRSFRPFALAATVAVACLVLGWSAGRFTAPAELEDWHDFVASYQALYVNPTLDHIDQSEPAKIAELERVTQAIGKQMALVDLTGTDQLDYKRAQILGYEGRPLIQLAFLSQVGAPIALCIMQAEESGDTDVTFNEMHGMKTAAWSRDGFQYLLIGGTDEDLIRRAGEQFAQAL
ncbi:MAG: hypothetical protein AAGF58_02870 [Pseudomonadota bacterium]